MDERLSPAQVRLLRAAADVSVRHGVELYLVGGTVRDILLGHRPVDLDISAAGATPKFASTLARELKGEVLARSRFGTAKLLISGGLIDLALARKESYPRPGALPKVEPGSVEDDLGRRDFTINAMAISLAPNAWANLVDLFDGGRDLERGLIRVLHPESFVDDSTRILRAVRYAARLGFHFEEDTERLLRRGLGYLDTITGDRLRHELERIFLEDRVQPILGLATELGVLSAIHPALALDETALANLQGVHAEPVAETALVYVSVLSYSVPTGQHPGLIARLNMDTRWAKVVRDTGSVRDAFVGLRDPKLRPSLIHSLLRGLDAAAIEGCRLATHEPQIAEHLKLYTGKFRHVRTSLNGDDLIALGVPEGPVIGNLLEGLLAAKIDGLLATRDDEERFVSRRLSSGPR